MANCLIFFYWLFLFLFVCFVAFGFATLDISRQDGGPGFELLFFFFPSFFSNVKHVTTKWLILHFLCPSVTWQGCIYSPDTDVIVLMVRLSSILPFPDLLLVLFSLRDNVSLLHHHLQTPHPPFAAATAQSFHLFPSTGSYLIFQQINFSLSPWPCVMLPPLSISFLLFFFFLPPWCF